MSATLIPDMPFADYLAHPALSATGMKRLLDSPARFKWEQSNPQETPALLAGKLIHAVAFGQPHPYTVKNWDGRTTEGKARAAEVAELGLEVVSGDDMECAEGIANSLSANDLTRQILYGEGVQHELSCFWTDPETGVELKCRFDAYAQAYNRVGDLKSTTTARPDRFAREAAKYGYLTSAAQYVAAAAEVNPSHPPHFFLVAAEKKAPYFVSVVGINEYDMALAEGLRRKAIRLYAECTEKDEWPDYTSEIAFPEFPGWWRNVAEQATGLYEIEVPA